MAGFPWFRKAAPQASDGSVGRKDAGGTGRTAWLTPGATPHWGARSYRRLGEEGYRRNVIAHRCVKLIAECAATVPVKVLHGGHESATHPAARLLGEPAPQTGGTAFLETLHTHLQISGNAYIEAVEGPDRRPRALNLLRPDRVGVVPGAGGWPRAYDYKVDGHARRVPVAHSDGRRPILHLKTFHPLDDHYGLSPLDAAAYGIDVHNAAVAWNKALLDNAARPSGALIFEPGDGRPATLSDDQMSRLKDELSDQFQGGRNAGRPFLLEGGLKWQPMALTPADMDYMNLKNSAARDIALAFGVPPMMLGIPGDNTYSNYQEANRVFWRLTVLPLVDRMLDSLGRWLAAWYEQDLALNADRDALPALAEERDALWRRIANAPFLTLNEKRAQLGLEPVEGGDTLAPAPGGGPAL